MTIEEIQKYIIENLPTFESGKSISAMDIFKKLIENNPQIQWDYFLDVMEKMKLNGEIRGKEDPILRETVYFRIPENGFVPIPPNQNRR